MVTLVPQLAGNKNYMDDVSSTLNKFTTGAIFSQDAQKILTRIRGLKSAVDSLQTIDTPQDVINTIQNITGINLNTQITNLQKKINPAELLPAFKQVSKVLKTFNQVALRILNFVRILQLTEKAQRFLVTVLQVIERILALAPIPLFPLIASVTQGLQIALQRIKTFLVSVQKVLDQISRLVGIIYSFILGLVDKVTSLDRLVQTIIFNLEVCAPTRDSPILKDLQNSSSQLAEVVDRLNAFTENYRAAEADPAKKTYNGFTLSIVEEELITKFDKQTGNASNYYNIESED
jgi:hypothetical protein